MPSPENLIQRTPLSTSFKEHLGGFRRGIEHQGLLKRSFKWGVDLHSRRVEEDLDQEAVKKLVNSAESELGLIRSEISLGLFHGLIKEANANKT